MFVTIVRYITRVSRKWVYRVKNLELAAIIQTPALSVLAFCYCLIYISMLFLL